MSMHRRSVNFRTLDLNLLRVFDAVMAEGSLTRAAGALAMTQPAASHAVKRLHDALGETQWWWAIMQVNNIKNPFSELYVGQVLQVPTADAIRTALQV